MDGNFKFKNTVILTVLLIIIFACENKKNDGQAILEGNFLEIVDTLAYETGSFRPIPPTDSAEVKKMQPNLTIMLLDSVKYNKIIEKNIGDLLSKNHEVRKGYDEVFEKGNYLTFLLNENFSKKIGKFNIDITKNENSIYIGEVEFCNLKIYKDKALVVVVKSEGHHKIAYLIFLTKQENLWKVVNKELLFTS